MILQLFRRTPRADIIASLYGMIVAQARSPIFYQEYGVPDTATGRFEMVALHTVLVLDRFERGGSVLRKLGQAIFDTFCDDMDASMRELGVGDLAVPRRMRRLGEAFYQRQAAYREGLAAPGPDTLAGLFWRTIFSDVTPPVNADRLSHYVRGAAQELAVQPDADLERGELAFPQPAGTAAAGAPAR